jgi:hypothetical protein
MALGSDARAGRTGSEIVDDPNIQATFLNCARMVVESRLPSNLYTLP